MSNLNLYAASNQWSQRPDDERFWTLENMLQATRAFKSSAREALVPVASLRALPTEGGIAVQGPAKVPATLTNWAFSQVSAYAGAPPAYLRTLPPDLASVNINYGLMKRGNETANLLLHKNGSLVARSLATDSYGRVWDCDLVERLLPLTSRGWRVPPARPVRPGQAGSRIATEADVLQARSQGGGLSVNVGDAIAPAGLYASDHDCFVFMVNEANRISDGTEGGLSRGFFLSNSEVANGKSLKLMSFMYKYTCGNHIVWGAEDVLEVKVCHKGDGTLRRFASQIPQVQRYVQQSAIKDEERVRSAKALRLGLNKQETLATLFKQLRGDISQQVIESSWDRAERDSNTDRTIDPNSAWGWVQGATAYSQESPWADEQAKVDKAAGKVLKMAF